MQYYERYFSVPLEFRGNKKWKNIDRSTAVGLHAAFVALVCLGVGAAEDSNAYTTFEKDGVYYTPINENTVSVSGCKQTMVTDLTIPSTVKNGEVTYSVTSIDELAFLQHTSLVSVTVPDSIISIGSMAFVGCISLTEITVSSNNPNYSSENGILFNKTKTILVLYPAGKTDTSYKIPDSVTSIGSISFYRCISLSSVTIPDKVASIGEYAFSECTSLAIVSIGSGVTSIGDYTFSGCVSLSSVTIPDKVASIGICVFVGCKSLTEITVSSDNPNYSSDNGVLFNKTKTTLMKYPAAKTGTTYSIPDSVASIGDDAFSECVSLSSVIIPDKVESIGSSAFSECVSLSSVIIPDKVASLDVYAFYGCVSLSSVTIGSGVTSIGRYAFSGCVSLSSVIIPDKVESIGGGAFLRCTALTSVTIPDKVESIGGGAFSGCVSLSSVIIPDKVESIDESTFSGCASLSSVTIGSGVTSIGRYAFSACTALTSVTIPDKVESIDIKAFSACTSLVTVSIGSGVTSIDADAFSECISLTGITVSSDNPNYSSDNGVLFNKTKTTLIQYPTGKTDTSYIIPDTVTSIGEKAFFECICLSSVTIPDSVISIEDYAFYGCISISSVDISAKVTSIKQYAFSGCTSLTTITVSSDNQYYSSENGILFDKDKTELRQYPAGKTDTSYSISDSIAFINDYAFVGCTSLTKITVASENNYFSSENGVLFSKTKTSLMLYPAGKTDTSYTIPDSVLFVDDNAFYGCTSLVSITVGSDVGYIGDNAFYGCNLLVEICNNSGIELVKGSTANGRIALNAVNIYSSSSGSSILQTQSIETGVDAIFYEQEDVITLVTVTGHGKSLVLPDKLIGRSYEIHDYAFYRHVLESVTIGQCVKSIGDGTFSNCTSLIKVNAAGETPAVLGTDVFLGCNENMKVFVPLAANATYKAADVWKDMSLYSYISVPQAKDDLVYDSTEQTGVAAATYGEYTLGGTYAATAAGDYTATATPNTGFMWSDDTVIAKSIDWSIAKKVVTVSGITAQNKVYDGTTAVTLTGTPAVDGKVGMDDVTVTSGTAVFSSKNVGKSVPVTLTGYALNGADKDNYSLASQPSASADITAIAVTVSGITANNKEYDGNTTAVLDYSGISITGIVGTDVVTASAVGTFSDVYIETGKTVTISNIILAGADAGNYVLASEGQQTSTTANISGTVKFQYENTAKAADDITLVDSVSVNEPTLPLKENEIVAGWYNGDVLWNFSEKVKISMVLTVKISEVTSGATVIQADDKKAVDVELNTETTSVTVILSEATVSVSDLSSTDRLKVSVEKDTASEDKFDVTVKLGDAAYTDKPIVITLQYNKVKGIPTVYYYPADGDKIKMDASVDEATGTVTFTTTHNSVYGIEYTEPSAGSNTVAIIVCLVVIVLIVLGILVYSRLRKN